MTMTPQSLETLPLPSDSPLAEVVRATLGQSSRTLAAPAPLAERAKAVYEQLAARTAVNRQWREQALGRLSDDEEFYVEQTFAAVVRAGATPSALQVGILEQFLAGEPIDLVSAAGAERGVAYALEAAWYADRSPAQVMGRIRQVLAGAQAEAARLIAHAPAAQRVGVPERLVAQVIGAAQASEAALQRARTVVDALDVEAFASERLQRRADAHVGKIRALWYALQTLRDGLAEVTLCGWGDAGARAHAEEAPEFVSAACEELTWQADRVVALPAPPASTTSPPPAVTETRLQWPWSQSPRAIAPVHRAWHQSRGSR